MRDELRKTIDAMSRAAKEDMEAENTTTRHCTANPLFVVQTRNRVYGFDPDYSDESVYVATDEFHVASAEEIATDYATYVATLKEETPNEEPDDHDTWLENQELYTKTAYQDFWVNVQTFFTRAGAEAYLENNAHNMEEPRVYVESAYRNSEMQAIRELLLTWEPLSEDPNDQCL